MLQGRMFLLLLVMPCWAFPAPGSALKNYHRPRGPDISSTTQLSAAVTTTPIRRMWPWAAGTGLLGWFLCVHTPFFWKARKLWMNDPILAYHILAAGSLVVACSHNCVQTPSTARGRHIWVGRVGLLAGTLSFLLGSFMVVTRFGKDVDIGFGIGISIGGILQVISQVKGYQAIQRYRYSRNLSDLNTHIGNMVSLFLMACCIPASIRIAETLAPRSTALSTGLIVIFIFALNKSTLCFIKALKKE